MNWIETHGLECLIVAYIISGIASVMPPLPMGRGWWTTWGYNVTQLLGANLGNLVKHTPAGAQIETMVGSQVHTEADGSKTTTEIATASVPKV